MVYTEVVKAALELGVIPALALFLVVGMFLQNRQLIKDRRDAEAALLKTISQVLSDYQRLLEQVNKKRPQQSERKG